MATSPSPTAAGSNSSPPGTKSDPSPRKKRGSYTKVTRPEREASAARWVELERALEVAEQLQANFGSWSDAEAREFWRLLQEYEVRQCEALTLYRPMPHTRPIHFDLASEIGLYGANRSGKTQFASSEVALALRGEHPHPTKYPRDYVQGIAIGEKEEDLGRLYDYLFAPGLFRIWQHPETFAWKVVEPDNPIDAAHQDRWRPSGPLIPRRYILEESWLDKKAHIPILVRLHNGSVIRFHSAMSKALPKGWRFHFAWIDEEVASRELIAELRARLIDFAGRLFWSATAQRATPAFHELFLKSQSPDMATRPISQQIHFYKLYARDNPYIAKEGVEAFDAKLDDPLERAVRIEGDFAASHRLAYPDYLESTHVRERFPLRWDDSLYLFFDPGIAKAAVLFCVLTAPPKPGDVYKHAFEQWIRCRGFPTLYCYDELLITDCDPEQIAQATRLKLIDMGNHIPQDLTIDQKGGRLRWAKKGHGDEEVMNLYWKALERQGVKPHVGNWRLSNSDEFLGYASVTMALKANHQADHFPDLYLAPECEWLRYQLSSHQKAFDAKGIAVGWQKENRDLLDLLRYAVLRKLEWVTPPDRLYKGSSMTRQSLLKLGANLLAGRPIFRQG